MLRGHAVERQDRNYQETILPNKDVVTLKIVHISGGQRTRWISM